MAQGSYVTYYRVSTDKQGRSGLGLEAQREAVAQYLNGGDWKVIAEFVEVESGRDNDRPQLAAAIQRCRLTGSKLLIAKMDRLARRVSFVSNLMDGGVEFEVANLPGMTRFTAHIYSAVGEEEARMIGERTKAALTAAKARGTRLGNPNGFGGKVYRQGGEARARKADEFAALVGPTIKDLHDEGLSLRGIVARLNEMGVQTANGGAWSAASVRNVLGRVVQCPSQHKQ